MATTNPLCPICSAVTHVDRAEGDYMEGGAVTGEDLAARLYAEQGYFVMYSDVPLDLGTITTEDECVIGRQPAKLPFRIAGQSNREEYTKQRERTSELTGLPLGPFPRDAIYFYRFEAAD